MFKFKVLSLKHREDRQEEFKKNFDGYDFEFFWGINGKEYQVTKEDERWIKGNFYEKVGIHIPSLLAANHSHIMLLECCIVDDVPYVIFEDDTKLYMPIDFSFEEIVSRDLDVFWLMPDKPSILAYIVWPSGARKLIDAVNKEGGLEYGLDYMWHKIKGTGLLKEDQLDKDYFWQVAGDEGSDITTLLHYGFKEKRLY